jgi:hypothetical protein
MLQCLDPAGVLNWQFYLYGHGAASPTLNAAGTLYTPGMWTNYYALRADAGLAWSSWPSFRCNPANTGNAAAGTGVAR